jgi:hypothetical protein
MAKLLSKGDEIGFTVLPYSLDTPIEEELLSHPSDHALGFVTANKETGERIFTYVESGGLIKANNHWSLAILKEFPYCEQEGPWIIYSCSPSKTKSEFGKILNSGETLHIDNWDTWSVEGKESKVGVITSWEIF